MLKINVVLLGHKAMNKENIETLLSDNILNSTNCLNSNKQDKEAMDEVNFILAMSKQICTSLGGKMHFNCEADGR